MTTMRKQALVRPMATPTVASRRIPLLRRTLLTRRHEMLARVAANEEELRWLGSDVEPQVEEEAQQEAAAELLTRLDARARAGVASIDRALARMAAGTYGRCATCGRGIAVARLEAMPEAATCVRCPDRGAHEGEPRPVP